MVDFKRLYHRARGLASTDHEAGKSRFSKQNSELPEKILDRGCGFVPSELDLGSGQCRHHTVFRKRICQVADLSEIVGETPE